MVPDPPIAAPPERVVRRIFKDAVAGFRADGPILILGHNDADGLSALAILARAFEAAGWPVRSRIVGRGENAWSDAMRAELAERPLGGLVVADLGVRPGAIRPGVPTIVIDHHAPSGIPDDATVISGFGIEPIPTSSLLAFWCAAELGPNDDLLWLAALGIVGDMADKDGWAEFDAARGRYGVTALREAAALVNAPRRSASGDASPALALLESGEGPRDVISGARPETERLHAARAEVKAELEAAKRVGPRVRDGVALIRFGSPCQIHPLVAQAWRGRLKGEIVLAANTGYRPGWVHFAARSARDVDLIEFLARHAPPGADENYGSGHVKATGGALRTADWNAFVASLGFGPDAQVQA